MSEDEDAPKKKKRKRPRTGDLALLLRTDDPLRARMVTDLLEQEYIPVATPGLEHRSMLGVFAAHVDIQLRVPEEDLERARAIVLALDEAEPAIDADEEPATYRAPRKKKSDDLPTRPVRLARVAAFVAFVIPGGGHMYVGRYPPAFVLVAVQVAVWFAFRHEVPFAILVWPLGFVIDAFVSTRICFITQGRARPGSEPRWAVATVATVVLGALFWLSGPGARRIAGPGDTGMCDFASRCGRVEVNATDCVIDAANDRLNGYAPVYGNACGSCLMGTVCDDADECARACQREWSEDD